MLEPGKQKLAPHFVVLLEIYYSSPRVSAIHIYMIQIVLLHGRRIR
jgi:hypothetical protein